MSTCTMGVQATSDCSKKIKLISTPQGVERLNMTDGFIPWEGDPSTLQDCALCGDTPVMEQSTSSSVAEE